MSKHIRNVDDKKVISFTGKPMTSISDGCVGEMSWNNEDVKAGIEQMFGIRKDEQIGAVQISDYGIKVLIVDRK